MQIIAHRGASGHVTENTMAAFQKAFEIGCDMIELDVHVCKSGELVVFHDFSLKKMTGQDIAVGSLNKSELLEVTLPGKHTIPFLDQVLHKFKGLMINIELKGKGTARPVFPLRNILISIPFGRPGHGGRGPAGIG